MLLIKILLIVLDSFFFGNFSRDIPFYPLPTSCFCLFCKNKAQSLKTLVNSLVVLTLVNT